MPCEVAVRIKRGNACEELIKVPGIQYVFTFKVPLVSAAPISKINIDHQVQQILIYVHTISSLFFFISSKVF